MPCPDSPNGLHEIIDIIVEDSLPDGSVEVTVTCAHCDVEGTMTVKVKKVTWDEDEAEDIAWDDSGEDDDEGEDA